MQIYEYPSNLTVDKTNIIFQTIIGNQQMSLLYYKAEIGSKLHTYLIESGYKEI